MKKKAKRRRYYKDCRREIEATSINIEKHKTVALSLKS